MPVQSDIHTQAVIIGGGPVGWASALAFAQAGIQTVLVARDEPLRDERTVALMQGSLAYLDGLGIATRSISDATPLETMRLIDGTSRLIRAPEVNFDANEIGHPFFALNVPVNDLVKKIQDVSSSYSNLVHKSGYAKHVGVDEGARVTLDSEETVTADLVVGADGRRSRVREAAGISVQQWDYPQTAIVTHFEHEKPHRNISTEFHTETGPFTLVPLHGNRSSLVCVVSPQEADRLMSLDDPGLIRYIEQRSRHLYGRLSNLGPRQSFPMSSQLADKMATGSTFLVGESGHAFPPIGAQGLNLGLRDVAELAQQMVHWPHASIADIAARYDRKRQLDVKSRTMGVDMLNRSLLTGFLPVQFARGIGLFAAKSFAPLRRTLMRQGLGAHAS
jgi:2-octaprenyl-6-methoxyphenol hydroxylase